jgi:uncharacterized MAPEG superfamily protein
MSRNPSGLIRKLNLEWSRRPRKEEDRVRGLNQRARQQAIVEQLADVDPEP